MPLQTHAPEKKGSNTKTHSNYMYDKSFLMCVVFLSEFSLAKKIEENPALCGLEVEDGEKEKDAFQNFRNIPKPLEKDRSSSL